jgi:hypothetical protein
VLKALEEEQDSRYFPLKETLILACVATAFLYFYIYCTVLLGLLYNALSFQLSKGKSRSSYVGRDLAD